MKPNDIKNMPLDRDDFLYCLLGITIDSQVTWYELTELHKTIKQESKRRGLEITNEAITAFLKEVWSQEAVKDSVEAIIKTSDPNLTLRKVTKHIRSLIKEKGKAIARRHISFIIQRNPEVSDKYIKALKGMGHVQ
tara:strand:+ start:3973 stop:4380 length:408 start_codon:yes stop_codon:yes gene_type:complete